MRTCKVNVPRHDVLNFPVNEMKIDPFWNDLYNPMNYKQP